jgi:cytochrome P450
MNNTKRYRLPAGYSLLQTMMRSGEFLKDPIKFLSVGMARFSGTYTALLGVNKRLIMTQNPDFINYILKENHKNYHKSAIAQSAARFMGNGILFTNGDFWLKQRRLIQPAFHKEKLQGLQSIIIRSITESLTTFPAGDGIDIYPFVHGVSFNVLIRSIFDIPLPAATITEIGQIFSDIQEFLIRDINQPLRRLFYSVTGEKNNSLKKAKRLREIIREIIDQRRTGNKENFDLLDMLLNSTYEDTGERMPEEQVIDELLILIFAGHETTANTLSWLLYLLASNQEVLEQLTASFAGKTIDESLSNEYLKATIHEGMRLYPAAWMTERAAVEDDRFGDFSFPAKTIIIPFFFGLHRDKDIWEDPLDLNRKDLLPIRKLPGQSIFSPLGRGQECVSGIISRWLKCPSFYIPF